MHNIMFAYDPPTPASESIGGLLRDWSSHRGGSGGDRREPKGIHFSVIGIYMKLIAFRYMVLIR